MIECNCGPQILPEKIRCWASKYFDIACLLHDIEYSYSKYNRKQCDKRFLRAMLSVSKTRKERLLAYLFYYQVRSCGWMFYNKQRLTPELKDAKKELTE